MQIAKRSEAFEPPKYLSSLIAAINDGAKAAQAGALLFALVGVYLLATAFSASDEDLLRGRAVTISQIGASLPIEFSFAIAPFVFVFLHVYSLARYDMLTANVRQFLAELTRTVASETDRERCRQLLANVEFVQALVAPRGSPLYSPVWRWLVISILAIFPVGVLLIVQINALRYQSWPITRTQQLALAIDLAALVLFFHRNWLIRPAPAAMSSVRRFAKLAWLPAVIMGLNLLYMNVVSAEADAELVRFKGRPAFSFKFVNAILINPLDSALCPLLGRGCRFLRVEYRTLVDHVWDDKAIIDLRDRDHKNQIKNSLAAIEGLVLRDRSLRFAMFYKSSLFAADLTGADLRNAELVSTRMSGAILSEAQLKGADLRWAELQGAVLFGARFPEARLMGADLNWAQLPGADLRGAQLIGANLSGADLQGADLSGAQLQCADLTGTKLAASDLSRARLWLADLDGDSDFGFSDLQNADFEAPPTDDEKGKLRALFEAIPDGNTKERVNQNCLSTYDTQESPPHFGFETTADQPVLVSDPMSSVFADPGGPHGALIARPTPEYAKGFVALLADKLAVAHPATANNIALRATLGINSDSSERRSLYGALGCRLLQSSNAGQTKLDERVAAELFRALRDAQCQP